MAKSELPLLRWTPEQFLDARDKGAFKDHGRVQLVNGLVWCDHCPNGENAAEPQGPGKGRRG